MYVRLYPAGYTAKTESGQTLQNSSYATKEYLE